MSVKLAVKVQIVLSIGSAVLEILFFCGIIFGFPLLQLVLEKEGYFAYLCPNISSNISTEFSNTSTDTIVVCDEQEAAFNLAFTIGLACTYSLSFPSGYLLDLYGTWKFRTLATALYSLGFFLLAFSSPSTSYLLFPALILLAGAGRGLAITNFQLSNFSKLYRGMVLTLMTGSLSSSVLTLFLIKKGYDSGSNVFVMLQITALASILLWLRTYTLMPKAILHFPVRGSEYVFGWNQLKCWEQNMESIEANEYEQASVSEILTPEEEKQEEEKQVGFKFYLKDATYYSNMFFYSFITLRSNFFWSSSVSWLRSLTDEENVNRLSNTLGFISLFSACISPFNGLIIDATRKCLRYKVKNSKARNLSSVMVSIILSNILAILLSIVTFIPSIYGSFVFYVLSRAFIHGTNTAFLTIHFPSYHFGKLYGLTNLVNGLISLLQYLLFHLSLDYDPTFFYINVMFLILMCLVAVHPIMVFYEIKRLKQNDI